MGLTDYFKCSFAREGTVRGVMAPGPPYLRIGHHKGELWPRDEGGDCDIKKYPCEIGKWHWIASRYVCRGAQPQAFMKNAGWMRLIDDPAVQRLCLQFNIHQPGDPPIDPNIVLGDQHCKLFEVQDRNPLYPTPFNYGLYYACSYWFPADFRCGRWSLIMQGGDAGAPVTKPYPCWTVSFSPSLMYFGVNKYYDPQGESRVFDLGYTPATIPKERWVPLLVYIKPSDAFTRNGIVKVWIDGKLLLDRNDISTCARQEVKHFAWSVAYYGGKEETGYILAKDVVVSGEYPIPSPTHSLTINSKPMSGVPISISGG